MRSTDVAILGAGQAGLAMSRCLSARGIDHLLIERGAVAERWRALRWAGLRLLTPNWMTRLPEHRYTGPDPDGFMTPLALVRLLEDYARPAPILDRTAVRRLSRHGGRYLLDSDAGPIRARCVVIATGACDQPAVPPWAADLPSRLHRLHSADYAVPDHLPPGGVLVVGAAATGAQIARELHAAGREVVLAVGRHTRIPRRYRGRDIFHWLDRTGILADRWDQAANLLSARRQPSLQLSGRGPVDLGVLSRMGVQLVGHAHGAEGARLKLSGTLAADLDAAEARCHRTLARIDAFIDHTGLDAPADPDAWQAPDAARTGPATLDLRGRGIGTVIFATGYRRDYGWLDLPVLDAQGELLHEGGVLPLAGLYALGLPFLRRRSSSFIDGVGRDAVALSAHLAATLGHRRQAA
ncbi:NAD(P)/FAD-dependent oxidoreductase [Pararhodobacter sp. SW119]|uniref:flavin-containing monooxygenase n=1 Tax=Pararhodobacter sp. SW119 TaxID=2780075 RepID=UPI001AE07D49|nr:NAD(P)/FAD-dependent oxidoreductase [Pararhodobacter sp. SW119]